ncbi:MAG: transposase [Thermoflexaceae bacterium]|nr:transposase [Thermoflexaceae bacterium]
MRVYPLHRGGEGSGAHGAEALRPAWSLPVRLLRLVAAASSKHARAETALNEHVRQIHQQSRGTYGSPRVHQQLRQERVRTCASVSPG